MLCTSPSSSSTKKRDVKPHGAPWGPQSRFLLCRRRKGRRSTYIYIYINEMSSNFRQNLDQNLDQQSSYSYQDRLQIVSRQSRSTP